MSNFYKSEHHTKHISRYVIGHIFLFIFLYSLYDVDSTIAVLLIRFLHLLFVLYITLTPFLAKTKHELQFYFLVSVFTMFHWIVMRDECILTLIEQKISGRTSENTFIGRVVKPVYNISNKEVTIIIIILLGIAVWRYHKMT